MPKKYHIPADQLIELVPDSLDGKAGCFATDRITVDGARVGYMYREEPDFQADSGWRFTAGDESEEYMNDAANFGIYALNTIANYDREIVQFLNAPIGSKFARARTDKPLIEVSE